MSIYGYAVDGGGVQVVDLASGEKIPEEILAALSDETVTKWAFNTSFERVCLSELIRTAFVARDGYKFCVADFSAIEARMLSWLAEKMGGYRGEGHPFFLPKWERIESYGPKFVENIVQAISMDILCYAMRTLSHCLICAHVHDELIIECREDVSLEAICEQMGEDSAVG